MKNVSGALFKIGCNYAEKWARGETIDPWADLQQLWNQFNPSELLDRVLRDPAGAAEEIARAALGASLDIDPTALVEEFLSDPGGALESIIGFNPLTIVDDFMDDPWGTLENLVQQVGSSGMIGSVLGSQPAFQLLSKALSISQLVAPALAAVENGFSVFALLDSFVNTPRNWKLDLVTFLCGGVNLQMVPLAAGAGLAGKTAGLRGGLGSKELFTRVGKLFRLKKGMNIRSLTGRGSTASGKVGCKLCRIKGMAPTAMSVALELLSGIDHPIGNYQDADGLDASHTHCFAPGTLAREKDRGNKNIEEVVIGDLVRARNAKTGAISWKLVTNVFHNTSDHYRVLHEHDADGNAQEIKTTDGHPFYVSGKGWVDAGDLVPGDKLLQEDGQLATLVSSVQQFPDVAISGD